MYAHELDIAAFIPSITIRSMTNDVFTEGDVLGRRELSLGGITPDKYEQPEDYSLNEKCVKFGACANV